MIHFYFFLTIISLQVSHHPMVVACHCEGRGWKFWADSNLKGKFWGRSIQLDPVGVLTLQFEDGETFQWSKVTTSIYNIILGKIYCDHYGTMRIKGSGNYSCKLKFKEQSIIDRNPHQVLKFSIYVTTDIIIVSYIAHKNNVNDQFKIMYFYKFVFGTK